MINYKLTIAYDGSRYNGFQKQSKHPEKTIQGKLEDVLSRCFDEDVQIIGSGRTDAGVHSKGQVCNFHVSKSISIEELLNYLASYLPNDIAVLNATVASERFHARYNVVKKCYSYTIDTNLFANPFALKYAYHFNKSLDLELMKKGASYLCGTHDYKAFTSLKSKTKSTIKTIHDINIVSKDGFITINYEGNGFLQHMVRILTGTLIEIGTGERAPESILTLLENKVRSEAGPTAPSHGLCMEKVTY